MMRFYNPQGWIMISQPPSEISPDFTNKTTSRHLHLHRPCIQASSFGSISCSSSQPLQEILGFEKRPTIHVDYFNGYLYYIFHIYHANYVRIYHVYICVFLYTVYVWIVDTLKWSKNPMSETTHLHMINLESWITHLKHFVKKLR